MGFFSQLGLMLWKNWIIQRRKICVSIFEVLLPLAFAGMLLQLRIEVTMKVTSDDVYYPVENIVSDAKHMDLPNPGIIGYAPNGSAVNELMTYLNQSFIEHTPGIKATFWGFKDRDAMEEFYKTYPDEMHLCIAFSNINNLSFNLPKNLKFAVRPYTGTYSWKTRQTYPPIEDNQPRTDSNAYAIRGVLYMQRLVGESLIKYWLFKTGGDPDSVNLGTYSQRFPHPSYTKDAMVDIIQYSFPIFLVLSFILNVIINTKNLVDEKEKKLKESMKLMGLKMSVHWLSWFITFWILLLPGLALYSIFICADITSQGPILSASNGTIFFMFLLCYGFSLITFCFMVSTFVQKANIASALAGILYFGTFCVHFYITSNYENLTRSRKLGMGLMFNCAMGLGANLFGRYEGTGEGVQWNNFRKPVSVDDNISLLDCLLMLIADGIIHLIIYWYIDNVRPGEFGVPKPFYFCFTKSYWFGTRNSAKYCSYYQSNGDTKVRFEREPENMKAGIQIKELKKVYGQKMVVQGLSLNMYEGQITVLLGHNGAGKTTTMSMLTGFIPPTSGTAVVNGYDITENIDGVRSSLGLCPQHNILFHTLTVKEHLQFFARLKGASKRRAQMEIVSLLTEVGLHTKINDRSQNLSGGQKRKLSVAIALVAGSKIVILDEPSSGMDPAARRQTWDVLQKHREGRTMLLTTHYMDEADVLGDRIAIMAEGVVKCCGSSMFLKKLYGAGYHFVIVKDQFCDVDHLTSVIKSHISNAKLEGVINLEVSYLLPDNETEKFSNLFMELELRKEKLGISSFGTSATTMEEVFLKVGDSAVHHDESNFSEEYGLNNLANPVFGEKGSSYESVRIRRSKIRSSADSMEMGVKNMDIVDFNRGYNKKTGMSLEMGRMYALFVKKALHTWRNRIVTLVQLLVPVIFVVLGLGLNQAKSSNVMDPPLTFDLAKFDRTIIPTTAGFNPSEKSVRLQTFYNQQFGNEQDIESFSLSASKYKTYDKFSLKRANDISTALFNKRVIIGLEVGANKPQETIHAISHYNGEPFHAQPIGINFMMNALLQLFLDKSYSMQSRIDPLPMELKMTAENEVMMAINDGFSIGIFISFGMAFVTTLFIHYAIKERQVGAKHLQVVSGVNPLSYWIPTFLWDFITYFVPCILLLIVFLCFQKSAYIGEERWLYVILVFIVYGWAILPFMYVLQFLFKEPSSGVVTVIMINIISGLVCLLITYILSIPGLHLDDLENRCNYIFMVLFPNYSIAKSFVYLYTNYENTMSCKNAVCHSGGFNACCKETCELFGVCFKYEKNYLAYNRPGIGTYLVCLLLQGTLFSILLLIIEYNIFQKLWYSLQSKIRSDQYSHLTSVKDSDVAEERQKIMSNSPAVLSATDSMVIVNLYKRYGQSVAVDHICVGIPEEECFGLLGQNGAGKTTTFKMLTGDVMVTDGNAYLNGLDIRNNIKSVQANMGYCPQFDALIDQMTGRETLTMYARLRGVPEVNIPDVVNHLIKVMMLTPHADKIAGTYSGGNKRKLSTAMALVGDPHFIMLDEPSAGMDPKARRQLWNVLSQVRASGRTLILTSHSMEECDALCTRIAIMVNGQFVCLGSPQHLKNKFGQGYTLIVQMENVDGRFAPIDPVVNFILTNFPGAKVFDDHQGYVHFQVPESTVKLAQVFSLMESTKVNLNVRDYSVHQTTLEQVFLTFTRAQAASKQATVGLFKRIISCQCFT